MKITTFLLFCGLANLIAGPTYSQNTKISLDIKDASIEKVLNKIEDVSEFYFLYNQKLIDVDRKVDVTANDKPIKDILSEIFGKDVRFIVSNRQIVLTPAEGTAELEELFQQQTVTGKITDAETGEPLAGVNIVVKGTTTGSVSNVNGTFSIPVTNINATLVFSFIGYIPQEIPLGGKSTVDVALKAEVRTLEEVVVVGYGTQKKVNLTGAVGTITNKDIQIRPTNNITKSLAGQVTGVTITERPGGSTSLNIRGLGSTAGASNPMYIIDGFEVSAGFFSKLDPNSIESISILKDASSTAIYGAKAAYGVVLVSTKKGSGKSSVSISSIFGTQKPTFNPKMFNSIEYVTLANEAARNNGYTDAQLPYQPAMVDHYTSNDNPDLYPNTDWIDVLNKKSSPFTKQSFSFQGGKQTSYFLNLGYQNYADIYPHINTADYTVDANINSDIYSWLSINYKLNYIYTNYVANGLTSGVYTEAPTLVALQSDGTWGATKNGADITYGEVPLRINEIGGRSNSKTGQMLTSFGFTIKPIKEINIINRVGVSTVNGNSMSFTNSYPALISFITKQPISGTSKTSNGMTRNLSNSLSISYDGFADYEKTFAEKHYFKALAGIHYESYHGEAYSFGRNVFLSNEMNSIDGGSLAATDQATTTGPIYESALLSYFGRVNYSFAGKYLLEANIRSDASSKFSSANRTGVFPSGSLGWIVSKEGFMKSIKWIDVLKLRASIGEAGNINNVGYYDYYPSFAPGSVTVIGGKIVNTVVQGRIANSNLTWEKTLSKDIGIDYSMKNGLLGITADYYHRVTSEILIPQNDVSSETGIAVSSLPARNIGSVLNSGIELELSHRNRISKDWSYSVSVNISKNHNEILDLGGVEQLAPYSPDLNVTTINKVGYPINSFYYIKTNGFYSTTDAILPSGSVTPKPGALKKIDFNGDNNITAADRQVCGHEMPDLTYGINLAVNYKTLTLSVLGQGIKVSQFYMWGATYMFKGYQNSQEWMKNYWTEDRQTTATYPKPYWVDGTPDNLYNYSVSDFWLFNADYFRIKNITLSWNVPTKLFKDKISDLRLFATGDNLFTFFGSKRTKDLSYDPEVGSGQGARFVLFKSLSGGLSITF